MKTIILAAVVTFLAVMKAQAGTAETRQVFACGIAKTATAFQVEYAVPQDGTEIVGPGVDGTTVFELQNITLLKGRKYCIEGDYTVFTFEGPGELLSRAAYIQPR